MLQGEENTFCASYCVERDQYLGVAGRGTINFVQTPMDFIQKYAELYTKTDGF